MKVFKMISLISMVSIISISVLSGCSEKNSLNSKKENDKSSISKNVETDVNTDLLNKSGMDIESRYLLPEGYKRVEANNDSFAYFLRHEKLKPYGEKSNYYNGDKKPNQGVYDSVFDVDLEGKNLLHCADACYKFIGDYLYKKGDYSKMRFKFVSGGVADFGKYTRGYRVDPETGEYFLMAEPSTNESVYKKFMTVVYAYSGTLSLVEDTFKVDIDDIEIGDMFVVGGTPGTKRVGHAIMVVDMAVNGNKKIVMLAQSYMPAQQTQILINKNNKDTSPWYSIDEIKESGILKTPQWTFKLDELRRFNIQ